MNRNFGAVFIVLAAFMGGFFHLNNYTDIAFIQRDPAAVKNGFDFTSLKGERLHTAAKERLLKGFQLVKDSKGASIGLGHFVFADELGQRKFACEAFSKVSFVFEAEGVSVAGEKPLMEVEGRCESSRDLARINPLYIPIATITKERPGDGDFQFNEKSVITVKFTNLPDQWPKVWLLKSLKIVNETSFDSITVESNEVAQQLGHPMVLRF